MQVIESLIEMTQKIKREFAHIILLIRWVTMHGKMWLPVGLIGCVFVPEVQKNDNGVHNSSRLSDYLQRLLRGCLTSARLSPVVFCDRIFTVLLTVVPRYVNLTPPIHLLNMLLNKFRQINEHVKTHHRQLCTLFAIPRYLIIYKKGVQAQRLCDVFSSRIATFVFKEIKSKSRLHSTCRDLATPSCSTAW